MQEVKVGTVVSFIPKGKKEQVSGNVVKMFKGTDGKEYVTIKFEGKNISKQVNALIWN